MGSRIKPSFYISETPRDKNMGLGEFTDTPYIEIPMYCNVLSVAYPPEDVVLQDGGEHQFLESGDENMRAFIRKIGAPSCNRAYAIKLVLPFGVTEYNRAIVTGPLEAGDGRFFNLKLELQQSSRQEVSDA